jgi:SH3-like domain-containing protein
MMRRTTRAFLFKVVPLLTGGTFLALMLLPAPPPSANLAGDTPSKAEQELASLLPVAKAQAADKTDSASGGTAVAANAAVPAPRPDETGQAAGPQLASLTATAADVSATPGQPSGAGDTAQVASLASQQADHLDAAANAEPAATLPDPASLTDGRVGSVAVNVRSGPSSSNDKLFVLSAGEPVRIAETSGGWVHVYRPDGEGGWVYGRYLAGHDSTGPAATTQVASAPAKRAPAQSTATAHFGDVRGRVPVLAAPDSDAAFLFELQPGERVRIAGHRDGWMRVVTSDGFSGWVPS